MNELHAVALALRYPEAASVDGLRSATDELPTGTVRSELEKFTQKVADVSLGHWEELHTRTLDLSPIFVPYVGHVAWGENYRRGAFMADLKRQQDAAGVDRHGELPDHIEPVLRYVAAVDSPLEDLQEVLPDAVATMRKELKKAEKDNPYRHVLTAAVAAVRDRAAGGGEQ